MKEIWAEAVMALGGTPDSGDLETRYAEPHRRYHNTTHVLAVVRDARTLAEHLMLTDEERAILTLAACAHDVIYDGRPGEDERASAQWARDHLTDIRPEHAERVADLVLATITHESADPLAHALLDADLAILGAPRADYDEYRINVRAEYARYDDATWSAGRTRVLRSLLDRKRLYVTEPAHRLWDAGARANMVRELRLLSPGPAGPAARP
ncbi:HD domain-containing protein [Pseudonocardiaceae bacterium YIM PH 21723]|nr:HD domain-containing protein [Pseudonocardiaceae bacterium YIM PH 21723]